MKILLVLLLVFAVSCATACATGKNPIQTIGTSKISESNPGVAVAVAFENALQKIRIAKCKFFKTVSVCLFPQEDKAEVILLGSECNPPKLAGGVK